MVRSVIYTVIAWLSNSFTVPARFPLEFKCQLAAGLAASPARVEYENATDAKRHHVRFTANTGGILSTRCLILATSRLRVGPQPRDRFSPPHSTVFEQITRQWQPTQVSFSVPPDLAKPRVCWPVSAIMLPAKADRRTSAAVYGSPRPTAPSKPSAAASSISDFAVACRQTVSRLLNSLTRSFKHRRFRFGRSPRSRNASSSGGSWNRPLPQTGYPISAPSRTPRA